ncbi:tRNA (guanine(6)-N2)-methyltransferase THUMP3-like [Lineus longissimus]|uniref:tRNA (guanine(6)-N2)-methyltransferase THUMP3-like n=1 Tax=Lineus longissimus TaxID=88925 RepID=UPI002B4EF6F4
MSAAMESTQNEKADKLCKIEATVVCGFENVAADEVFEKFGVRSSVDRGHITFTLPIKDIRKVKCLHAVENLYVLMNSFQFNFSGKEGSKEDDIKLISDTIPHLDWETGLAVWKQFIHFKYDVSPKPVPEEELDSLQPEELPPFSSDSEDEETMEMSDSDVQGQSSEIIPRSQFENLDITLGDVKSKKHSELIEQTLNDSEKSDSSDSKADIVRESVEDASNSKEKKTKVKIPVLPGYRVTCNRTGNNHSFASMEVAASFGALINDYFHWNVDLTNFDIEILLRVEDDKVRALLALTKKSLGKRHISQFGPTSLKATIAYCMLRMCNIKDGDVVCDPMCGGGSIPIEGAVSWPNAHHICGDIHKLAWPRTLGNIDFLNKKRLRNGRLPVKVDVFQWDTTNLPLKDDSVDVMAIDMPFGKKSGSKFDNRRLYPAVLSELARVTKRSTGRACLLTFDKRTMTKTLSLMQSVWRWVKTVGINMGGLNTGVFLLTRTSKTLETPLTTTDRTGGKKQKTKNAAVTDGKETEVSKKESNPQ